MGDLYGEDLAFVHASAFGDLAAAATASVIPELTARGARRVVDIGCGAGVSTRALVEAGFDVLAVEPSAALLDLARKAAPSAHFQQASAYEVALAPCDAVLAFGEALTYHGPTDDAEARLREFFGKASRALGERGLLAFDLIETGEPPLDGRTWRAGDDWAVLTATREDAPAGKLTREIETFREFSKNAYRRSKEVHQVRSFERAVVVAWLEQAGFDVWVTTAYGELQLARRRVAFRGALR